GSGWLCCGDPLLGRSFMLRCALLLLTLLLPCALPAANLRLVGDSWPPFVDSRLPGNGLAVELVATAL
uniref:hypothetical protein n=1 Tax=Neisseria meningitidis TaxID=487 RepID=UPI001C9951BC